MDLVKQQLVSPGRHNLGPLKIIEADETDLSTPDVSYQVSSQHLSHLTFQLIFQNYTSVSAKWQRSLDGLTWDDTGTELTLSGDVADFAVEAPHLRLSIGATLSANPDTLEIWAFAR